jgi:hypothetical protein
VQCTASIARRDLHKACVLGICTRCDNKITHPFRVSQIEENRHISNAQHGGKDERQRSSEVLLGEAELDVRVRLRLGSLLERLGDWRRPAEVRRNLGAELRVCAREVLAGLNGLAEARVDVLPVRTTEHSASAEERERVVRGTGVVDSDVPEHVLVDLLREVDVDAQEVG